MIPLGKTCNWEVLYVTSQCQTYNMQIPSYVDDVIAIYRVTIMSSESHHSMNIYRIRKIFKQWTVYVKCLEFIDVIQGSILQNVLQLQTIILFRIYLAVPFFQNKYMSVLRPCARTARPSQILHTHTHTGAFDGF